MFAIAFSVFARRIGVLIYKLRNLTQKFSASDDVTYTKDMLRFTSGQYGGVVKQLLTVRMDTRANRLLSNPRDNLFRQIAVWAFSTSSPLSMFCVLL